MNELDKKTVNVIRGLILDTTRNANSGHPGGALSSTDMAYVVYRYFLNYNPSNPQWINRDRFVLSAGHESALLYSLIMLQGFLPLDELKRFRQLNSLTPGHPEYGLTDGVDATTGPLGQGISMAVGMAVAEEILRSKMGSDVINHYTYVLAGDGDLQEPIALGSAELAGHWGLSKMIVLYDKNNAQISGNTTRADSTDVATVFKGFGWNVLKIDGHDHEEIKEAIEKAKSQNEKPTIIIGNTIMAKGSVREGDYTTHGSPLKEEEIAASKEKLGLPKDEKFYVPDDVIANFRTRENELKDITTEWSKRVNEKLHSDEAFKKLWEEATSDFVVDNLEVPEFVADEQIATRSAFGKTLAKFAEQLQTLVGGSADLEPSNSTAAFAKFVGDFTKENRNGRNFAFGVREFPMGAIVNGIALHGGLRPFGATFLVFSDYERHTLRLSAMQHLHVLHVFTHDSFYVGEDGPTHQPIEHLMSLRLIPNLIIFRPADAKETAAAMKSACDINNKPSVLALTRQKLPVLEKDFSEISEGVKKGAYVVWQKTDAKPDLIFIATGSEVHLAIETAKMLGEFNARVVSMPSMELFEMQSEEYKNSVIPSDVKKRVTLEAGTTLGWERYAGDEGITFGINHYGKSAPYKDLEKDFGFTPENVAEIVREKFTGSK